jgi:hypothetical protein
MQQLTRTDLMPLEVYADARAAWRAQVIQHKKHRKVSIGAHAALYFEDRTTIQYQIQEMLRAERIFERDAIQDELDAYNPLIPDGTNLKATFMLEYTDPDLRKVELARLIGVEDRVWLRVAGHDKIYAIADEDMARENAHKTSSVHFLRFEFDGDMIGALKSGAALAAGIDHENCRDSVDPLPQVVRGALLADLD